MVDSSFWIALADEGDQWSAKTAETLALIEDYTWLIPWPTLYEFINTRLMRRGEKSYGIRRRLRGPGVLYVDDTPYRDRCLEKLTADKTFWYTHSLVDSVMRSILEERLLAIDALVTFNRQDFEDVCHQTGVEILPYDK